MHRPNTSLVSKEQKDWVGLYYRPLYGERCCYNHNYYYYYSKYHYFHFYHYFKLLSIFFSNFCYLYYYSFNYYSFYYQRYLSYIYIYILYIYIYNSIFFYFFYFYLHHQGGYDSESVILATRVWQRLSQDYSLIGHS